MTNLLEFDNIHYAYPSCPESLSGVTFSIKKGAKVALVGPNGAGKTTLMLMCNGVLEPSKGRVLLDGEPLRYDSRSLREVRKKVGMVFQNQILSLRPTVYQDVAFGPLNLGMEPDRSRRSLAGNSLRWGWQGSKNARHTSEPVGRKSGLRSQGRLRWTRGFSYLMNQPVRSTLPVPAHFMELLDELHAKGATIIISTHDVELHTCGQTRSSS